MDNFNTTDMENYAKKIDPPIGETAPAAICVLL